ncbi:MAG: 3-dehydroquinate synthase family protein [Saprospiraceae bacterium]
MPDSPLLLQNKPIVLGALETHLRPFLSEKAAGRAVFVVADENTIGILPSFLADHPRAVLPPGEQHKTLAQCEQVWTQMLAASLDRNALVLNFGGGVIGDLGGFCAAAYKRGIDFIQIPTTLLAMTDAAIGGKTGIDLGGLKNVVGAFRQPEAVFVDPALLATLPERELRSGLAEVYKHAFIADPDLLERIRGIEPGAYQQVDWLAVLRQSIRVKVQVVAQDPLERGLRALLNFGHTIGHAVESYFLQSSSPLTHGEAIAVGMVAEMAIQNRNTPEN